MSQAINDVIAERKRQIEEEGWTPEHDEGHTRFELAAAGACYAENAAIHFDENDYYELIEVPEGWPWEQWWWKPKDPRRDLVRAAALIIAEIDRIDREDKDNAEV